VAAIVASADVESVQVVDPNPAQLALGRFKLELLRQVSPAPRLQILGHEAMEPSARQAQLAELFERLELAPDAVGPVNLVSQVGVDHCGRYEMLFRALRHEMSRFFGQLKCLIDSRDIAEQTRLVAADAELGVALDQALDQVFSLSNLVVLFGPDATANRVEDFSRHFARRIRAWLAAHPASESPWLAQMLVGRFGIAQSYPWLGMPAPASFPKVIWTRDTMQSVLASAEVDSFDFIHLSNILDWLSPGESAGLMEHAWKALARGGRMVIRQLNSALDIPATGPQFNWLKDEANRLHATDRSFFYRELHVGTKR
jgi:S-adenosylmethionine-diacylglycerol 3-amino-3-carboxypropyl transferase